MKVQAAPLCAVLLATTLCAQETTKRSTEGIPLDGSGHRSLTKNPKPKFVIKDVTVKVSLTVDAKTGEVTETLEFVNEDTNPHKFLFCNMVALKNGTPKVAQVNRCDLKFDATAGKWICSVKNTPIANDVPNYHFGCVVVDLKAKGDPKAKFSPPAKKGQNDAFKKKSAWDFQVSYADIFDLGIGAFDETTCQWPLGMGAGKPPDCFGADTNTNLGQGTGRAAATGYWIMSEIPITDPYVLWHEFTGAVHAKEYFPLSGPLSLPSAFPFTVPGLGRALPGTQAPLSYVQDLNLWDIFTMSDPPSSTTPVSIVPFLSSASGVTVSLAPSFASIAGGSMNYGTMTITRSPSVPEGTRVQVSAAFVDPGNPNDQYWEQDATLIQDTSPPVPTSHSECWLGQQLVVDVAAIDLVTSPVAASFFYSLDGGASWDTLDLDGRNDPFSTATTNAFAGSGTIPCTGGQQVDFFFAVQDSVFNHVLYGPGRTTCPGAGVVAYGAGCPLPSTGGPPLCCSAGGPPQVGNAGFELRLARGVPNQFANALFIGIGRVSVPVAFLGDPTCRLLTSPFFDAVTFTSSAGVAVLPIPVPNSPGLIGGQLTAQWVAQDPLATPFPFRTSNGLEVTIQP